MSERFLSLEDVVRDGNFPEVDLALRKGRHIDREDVDHYAFLDDAQRHLEELYRRYGCELVRADGYFYLLPAGDRLGRRTMSAGEMLVGQSLALLYLDPSTLKDRGIVARTLVISRLVGLVGETRLIQALNFRYRKSAERVAQEALRREIEKALLSLARMGFVEVLDEESIRIRCAVVRFAEPVRGLDEPGRGLERLIATGRAVESVRDEPVDPVDPVDADDDAEEG